MKFLITGHKGYIGQSLIRKLKILGHHTTGIDINYFNTYEKFNINLLKADNDINIDLRKINKLDLANIDVFVHLAALSNDPMGQLDPELTNEINYELSVNLAKIAKKAGVEKFIYSSSCSVYGVGSDGEIVNEDSKLYPITEYAKSKIYTENELIKMDTDNFKTIFLRNATAFGVSKAMRCDLVVSDLIGSALLNNKITIKSDGEPWRPLIHIDDISNAIISFSNLDNKEIKFNAYNIGSSKMNYKVKNIAKKISERLNNTPIEITNEFKNDTRSYRVDFNRLENQFNKSIIEWNLEKGIDQTINYFLDTKIKELYSSRYFIRLKQLNFLVENNKINKKLEFI